MRLIHFSILLSGALVLAACTGPKGDNSKVRITDTGNTAAGLPTRGPMETGAIKVAFSGNSFQYTSPAGNGLVTFNEDGTTTIQDGGNSDKAGTWRVNGQSLCQGSAGAAEICEPINNTGDAIYAGKTRFVLM